MMANFRIGGSYVGTATVDRKRKAVFQVVGRRGGTVSIMLVNRVVRPEVKLCDGKECAIVRDAGGMEFFVSASLPVDIGAAFEVVEMCKA